MRFLHEQCKKAPPGRCVQKRERGMTVPVTVVIGDRDQVEHEPALRKTLTRLLPQATFQVLKGIGHLSPLEAPNELADACTAFLKGL